MGDHHGAGRARFALRSFLIFVACCVALFAFMAALGYGTAVAVITLLGGTP